MGYHKELYFFLIYINDMPGNIFKRTCVFLKNGTITCITTTSDENAIKEHLDTLNHTVLVSGGSWNTKVGSPPTAEKLARVVN